MSIFINLTPHAINVIDRDDQMTTTFEPSGALARVSSSFAATVELDDFALNRQIFGEVENLPDPKEGIIYIVSGMVLDRCKGRSDVVAPRTDNTAVRNEKGHIVAVRGFV